MGRLSTASRTGHASNRGDHDRKEDPSRPTHGGEAEDQKWRGERPAGDVQRDRRGPPIVALPKEEPKKHDEGEIGPGESLRPALRRTGPARRRIRVRTIPRFGRVAHGFARPRSGALGLAGVGGRESVSPQSTGAARDFTTRAGFPATTESEGTDRVTTARAATIDRSPMVTPLRMVAHAPIQTSLPMTIGLIPSGGVGSPLRRRSASVGCPSMSIRATPPASKQWLPIRTDRPIPKLQA